MKCGAGGRLIIKLNHHVADGAGLKDPVYRIAVLYLRLENDSYFFGRHASENTAYQPLR